ncbi:T9SS type A sorting domain-containing protein [Ferruginibacter sp.]|nr:T9SS type A sorting domain-containing protein [Ferruginibacter sp.]
MKKYFALIVFIAGTLALKAQTTFIYGPIPGSERFGSSVTVLPNGNYVVHDFLYDNGSLQDVGAVYLYNGSNHTLISTLTGKTWGDRVGTGQLVVLSNSNFLLTTPRFHDPVLGDEYLGAVTFINGTTGLNGVVDESNSLVGSQANDNVGADGITVLSNNNYVVRSQSWKNGNNQNAGAVTWGSGTTGVSGIVSSSNSLVGSNIDDKVGAYPITQLINGNYVVSSPLWNKTGVTDAGAVTWCSGTTGRSGVISSSNSLVGSTPFDEVGNNTFLSESGVTALTNGNYVVSSPSWDNGGLLDHAGAVTWCNGTVGITGAVDVSNSLVGSHSADFIGGFITPLTNGNYVVSSPYWANGMVEFAGAATWGNGTTGTTGEISSSNSLVGSQQGDGVGNYGIIALTNGNYVVCSAYWANGTFIRAGAATWGNGNTGIVGVVSSTNSLVGTKMEDFVGVKATALPNGNYVISSRSWANGIVAEAGASTWANGNTGITGVINSTNSLVGTKTGDRVGQGVSILSNGNYLVKSTTWGNGAALSAGAVTWANGSTGITGFVSSANSLVGTQTNDVVGSNDIVELTNGNYVVVSSYWNNGGVAGAGAVTWGSGIMGITGIVSNTNSLVGSHAVDHVGEDRKGVGVYPLTNGNYVVNSKNWDNGSIVDAGASTWCNGNTGAFGLVSTTNSIVGSSTSDLVGDLTFTLPNGNYLIHSPLWNNGAALKAGAVTWANGNTGIVGTISASNSLVGTTEDDNMGLVEPNANVIGGITILPNGNYIVQSRLWDNGAIIDAGAVTFSNGSIGVAGTVNSCNSVLANANTTPQFPYVVAYNTIYNYMLVGRSVQSIVNIYNPTGMALGVNLDNVTQFITGNSPTSLVVSNVCRIVASVLPTGITNPVNGYIEAKVWVQTTQPASFVKRHYQITPDDNAETATGKVTLYFTQQEFTDFNAVNAIKLPINAADAANNKANLLIEKRTGISSDGTGLPASYPTATAPVTINPADADIFYNSTFDRWEVSFNVTGFSGFFVKTQAAVLPLTLLNFQGIRQADNNLLQWQTASEVNTKSFELQSSTNGLNFTITGNVKAIGTGDNRYSFTDNATYAGTKVYYRLKMLDIDGQFTYSNIVVIHFSANQAVSVFPNPATTIVNIHISNSSLLNTTAILYNMQGQAIQSIILKNQLHKMNMQNLASGIYMLRFSDGTAFKIIKE